MMSTIVENFSLKSLDVYFRKSWVFSTIVRFSRHNKQKDFVDRILHTFCVRTYLTNKIMYAKTFLPIVRSNTLALVQVT